MRFVALLSGGKDSCYTIVELLRQGHTLVCLANLYPPSPDGTDADSFMYQSAGHDAIATLAQCLDRPLLRRQISGTSANQSLQYHPTEGDEVEDLHQLLRDVMADHPDVDAVASGAIFSTYQRTRVENVCTRLGLASLAPLWQRPQELLLQDMIASRVDAVVIKVASMGLDPHKHLGKPISRLQPHFLALNARHGFHVCGEGGEYETLTLDCPAFVRRLVLDETDVVMHSDDAFAPVALLRILRCSSVEKTQEERALDAAALAAVGHPDDAAAAELKKVSAAAAETAETVAEPTAPGTAAAAGESAGGGDLAAAAPAPPCWLPHVYESSGHMHVSGITCGAEALRRIDADAGAAGKGLAPAERSATQATACIEALAAALAARGGALGDAAFVHLYLSDITHFAAVNAAYAAAFERDTRATAAPASRACVQARLPPPFAVMLDCIAQLPPPPPPPPPEAAPGAAAAASTTAGLAAPGTAAADGGGGSHAVAAAAAAAAPTPHTARGTLLVRSLSGWAPVCIGPYSQANTLAGGALVLLSGQIGLRPCTMEVAPGGLGGELPWCVRHAARVLGALGSSASRGTLCATLYVTTGAAAAGTVSEGASAWWERTAAAARALLRRNGGVPDADADGGDSAEEGWNSQEEEGGAGGGGLAAEQAARRVPLAVVAVDRLPRGCETELELLSMSHVALALLPCAHYRAATPPAPLRAPRYAPPAWVQMPPAWVQRQSQQLQQANSAAAAAAAASGAYTVATEASLVERVCCQVLCTVLTTSDAPTTASAAAAALPFCDGEALAAAVLAAVARAAAAASLEWGHVASLRAYHPPDVDGGYLREALLLALAAATRARPALSLVPVAALAPGAVLVVHACVLDLPKLQTEVWVRRPA